MAHHSVEVSPALGDQLTALLNIGPHLRKYKLRIYLTVAFHERLAEGRGDEVPSRLLDLHIGPLDDVVDVRGNRGICADSMLLHLGNELGLCQVARWLRPAHNHFGGYDVDDITNFIQRYFFVSMSLPRLDVQEPGI